MDTSDYSILLKRQSDGSQTVGGTQKKQFMTETIDALATDADEILDPKPNSFRTRLVRLRSVYD
jgi:hypothetical protein